MTDPLRRLKALMGGEAAFVHAEANAKAQMIVTIDTIPGSNPLDKHQSGYIDPVEHDRVDSHLILESLLLSDHNIGKTAPHDMSFTPFWTVKNKALQTAELLNPNKISASSKASSDFWSSEWNLYYLTSRFTARPLILIPTDEAKSFLHKVQMYERNELKPSEVQIPSIAKSNYLFNNARLPRPRHLGQTRSKASFNILEKALLTGSAPFNTVETTDEATFISDVTDNEKLQHELSVFQKAIETMAITNIAGYREVDNSQTNALQQPSDCNQEAVGGAILKTDWKAKKAAARNADLSVTKERWCSSLKRVQRYLGLRATNDPRSTTENRSDTDEPILDHNLAPRYRTDLDVIFICLDIEADETDLNLVTEIGIAVLDTRDIRKKTPGPVGVNWTKLVRGKHFRIEERAHIRNHIFVKGNPLNFDGKFGQSELVPQSEIAVKVKACFEPKDITADNMTSQEPPQLRKIVLLGHNIKSDIKWLYKIDVDILNIDNLVEVLTTEDLQKALKHDQYGGTSLARLLQEMEVDAWNLHNAGNDAAYTLQAMLVMALKGLSITRPIVGLEDRIKKAQIKAREDAEAEWDAWDAAEMRSKDGNMPVPYRSSALRV